MAGETPELKIPYPEAKDERSAYPALAKILAERIDLLLRKQLTKLLEVAKLKVTETLEVPAASIKGPGLGTGTVRQETGTTQSFMSWGYISATGAIESGSGDYTLEKTGTGTYVVKWTTEKASAKYGVVTSVYATGDHIAETSAIGTTTFTIATGEIREKEVALSNAAFGFIALAAS